MERTKGIGENYRGLKDWDFNMKLAIVGSRVFNDYELLKKWTSIYITNSWGTNIIIISGGAKGTDTFAEQFAIESGFETYIYLPDWNKYGKSAGFKRNQQIIDNCDILLAFWDGKSKGTQDSINKAKLAKKPTFIVYF